MGMLSIRYKWPITFKAMHSTNISLFMGSLGLTPVMSSTVIFNCF